MNHKKPNVPLQLKRVYLVLSFFLLGSLQSFGQCPDLGTYPSTNLNAQDSAGAILKPDFADLVYGPLNPNKDKRITDNGELFSSTTLDPDNFEVPFVPLFHYSGTDPNGDNDAATCQQSDITDIPGNLGNSYYSALIDSTSHPTNPDYYMAYRARIGQDPGNGSFAYSVLIDLDNLLGSGNDPNYVAASGGGYGNPGFEIEIIFSNGNTPELTVYDIDGLDGLDNSRIIFNAVDWGKYLQKSVPYYSRCECSNDAIFFDFGFPMSAIQDYICVGCPDNTVFSNFDETTPIITIAATSTTGNGSLLEANNSDFGGMDDDGCGGPCTFEESLQALTENQPAQPVGTNLSFTADVTGTTSCGDDGTATATTFSGVPPYTFSWSSGGASSVESGLAAGDYFLTIADVNNTRVLTSITIPGLSTPIVLSASTTTVTCGEDGPAVVSVSVSNGDTPYIYSWSNAEVGASFETWSGGTYSVTVTDANNCSKNTSVNVPNVPDELLISTALTVRTPCEGETYCRTEVTTTGGTGPTLIYSWSDGSTTSILNNLDPDTYQVTVTDQNGCKKINSVQF